ncbi:MAG TPA: ADOP family duplicated permease, partial [Thermoanaerobaculia bacterium]|nr:ADOP family duplicated permease [Thermoanaerobaculia bacterium]
MRIEHWWFTAPLRLRSIFRRNQVERELAEELQFHLEHKIEEGIAAGLSPKEARTRAMRAMGGLEQRKVEMREMRRVHWLTDFLDDVQYAVVSLRRTPGLAALVVATLALGIGMTTTPFSMVDALIFRPYPVPHPNDVVTLVSTSRDQSLGSFSYREYLDIRDQAKSYDGVIAHSDTEAVGVTPEPGATPQVKGGMMVSANYLAVLGVQPQLGRDFRASEDQVPGRDAVVVLGPGFWKNQFASDPAVIGRRIRLNGTELTIIGVAPDSFPGMQIFSRPDFYVPLSMARVFSTHPQKDFFEDRDDRELSVKARLTPDVTLGQARTELAGIAQSFEREFPALNRDRGASVRTQFEMRTTANDVEWKFSVIFLILALAVLLVACTNVAGLLLSRARTRTREIAVRLALGAGRFRLIRLLLTESLILAFLGGLGGLAVGYVGIELFSKFSVPTELPVTIPFRMDTRVLLASLAVSLASAFFCGLTPALQSTRADLANGLKSADVDLPGKKRLWGRNVLVIAQVAMSLMLLTATFLMARSFQHSVIQATGFAKDHLLMARFDPRLAQYDAAQTERFYDLLAARVRETPGVRSATFTASPPLSLNGFESFSFVPEGFQMPRDRASFTSTMDTVDEGFFDTMEIRILRGRGFLTSDRGQAPRVAVVNEQFAKHYWPDGDALGKRVRLDGRAGTPVEIVGIAQTIQYRETGERPMDFVYLPFAQHRRERMVLLLRSSDDPLQMVEPLKRLVRALAPNLPIVETRSYEDLYR